MEGLIKREAEQKMRADGCLSREAEQKRRAGGILAMLMKSLFYWLNRRNQKKSYNWVDFLKMLDTCHPLAEAKIYVNIYAQ